ncbi:protease [Roseomonas frigidaquae]|uniref:Protease n=1 Tax=Falsiroseomonas frigidaquae TaxID=487318 RepID=A0ABX1EW13_9PROT|nr:protease [Falsiroseomonas frigidaquae]NKE43609.1 protease [Falsiroseomonas frigidaquae]
MLKLAFLLIGSQAFKSQWHVLSTLGAALVLAAGGIALWASDRAVLLAGEAAGLLLAVIGLLTLAGAASRQARMVALLKPLGLIVIGALILDWPVDTRIALPVLFSIAFAFDGIGRIATALVVRLPRWRSAVTFGLAELTAAALILAEWPLPHSRSLALCIGIVLALAGWLLIRFGLMLRTLDSEVAILNLPIFGGRGWFDSAPVLVGTGEGDIAEHPMTVHVWTPAGCIVAPERRLLIDRYVAAVDADGVVSTGHAALEMGAGLYISHYPAVELQRSGSQFLASLRGTAENDLKGLFQPSYAHESDWWCPADAQVIFRNYNPRRLRAFWAGYRQDDTYNLTNRNCAVVVAHALEAALEGSLHTRFPWARLVLLLANPDIWIAAMIRSRAHLGTWTPGMTLDYARTLARIVEQRDYAWSARLRDFLRRLRPGGTRRGAAAA